MKFKKNTDGSLVLDTEGNPIEETEDKALDLKEQIRQAIAEAGLTQPDTKGAAAAVAVATSDPKDRLLAAPKGEWGSMVEFCLDVVRADAKGDRPEKLMKWHTAAQTVERAELRAASTGHMEESELGTGGYLVPEEFRAELQVKQLEKSIVRSRSTMIPMSVNTVRIPVVDVSSHATNFFGGVVIYRPDEAGSITASRPKLGRIELNLHKLTGLVYVSSELLDDSPISLEPILKDMFAQAIAFTEDADYLMGNGSNKPLGVVNAANPALVSVTRTTSSEINWDDIINMWARLHPASLGNAVWVANIDTFPQLATMSMPVGTGGVPVWLPANGAAAAPFGTLMGKTLLLTEKLNTVGTTPDIALIDFSQYWIGQKAGGNLKVASSIHVAFTTDEMAFRFTMRYDGQPSWLNKLTPHKGSNTLSPFVTLAS